MPNIPPDLNNNDTIFTGNITFGKSPTFPAGAIEDADILAGTNVGYTKLANARTWSQELYAEGVTVASISSKTVHVVRGTSGTIIGLDGFIGSTLASTANTLTVDLQLTTAGSSAWATVCSTPLTFLSTGNATQYTRYSATLASSATDIAVGEMLRLVVTAAGSTTTAAKGLHVAVHWAETPT